MKLTLARLVPFGDVYVLSDQGVCGPLNSNEWQGEDNNPRADWASQAYDFRQEDTEWADSQQWHVIAEAEA